MAMKELVSSQEISFKVPWGIIQAKAWGPDDGKPFIGLHGMFDNANTFDKLVPLLPDGIRFVAIDFPGQGKSSHRWPGMPLTLSDFSIDVRRVVTQLGWQKLSIVGHSIGGFTGLIYAGIFPDQVENVILLDTRLPPNFSTFSREPAKLLAKYSLFMSDLKTTPARVFPDIESAIERKQCLYAGSKMRYEDAKILMERGATITKKGVTFSHDKGLKSSTPFYLPLSSLKLIVSNIRCRVLVLEGSKSKQSDREDLEELLGVACEHAAFSFRWQVPAAHHLHLECPEETAEQITEFLSLSHSPRSKL